MKSILQFLLATIMALVFSSCKKESDSGSSELVLQKNTIVANQTTNSKLVAVEPFQLIFEGSSMQLNNITAGDIIVSAATDLAPYGYLRKVLSVSKNGNLTVLSTSNATLEDAIKECNYTYSRTFAPADTMTGKKESVGFGSEINLILHDKDGLSSTTNDRITLTGSYEITPDFLFELKMKSAQVNFLKMGLGLTETIDIHLKANLYTTTLLEKEILLANYPLAPIVMWVGHFPIVVRPVIKFKAGHETGIQADVNAGWTGALYQEAYLEYSKGNGWKVLSNKTITPNLAEHTLTGSANAETYIKAEMQFILYDFEGVTASLFGKSYLQAEGTCTITPSGFNDCNWNIKAGFKAGGETKVQVFGYSLIDYSATIFDYSTVIYETTPQANGKIPITISNLNDYFTDINGCWMSDISEYGSSHTMTFDIDDPVFNPYNYFEIRSVGHFNTGVMDYDYLNSNSPGVKVVDYNTISINWCTYFGNSSFVDHEITLLNNTYQSQPLSLRIYKPYGANKNNNDAMPSIRAIQ
ncbi:MAG: hypothetical protein KIS94_02305 [Chitinophagales bacterium]|nr:hypothetical protein [Chitinophagales bacterium]